VLGLLLALGLAVRLGWGWVQPADDATIDRLPDQREYLSIARNLLAGRGLYFYDLRFNDTVHAFRTPGYPAFLAACVGSVRVVRVAQAVVDTSTVLAVYLLARALLRGNGNRPAALLAAGLVAFNPFLIYFSALLLTETLFTAMIAWGMLLLAIGGRGGRLRLPDWALPDEPPHGMEPAPRPGLATLLWLAGGLLLSASALVRPSGAPLAVLLGIAAAFVNRPVGTAYQDHPQYRLPWRLPVGSTMLLLTLLVLLPWAIRNRRLLGHWVWTTTNDGVTLYDGFNPDADGSSDQAFLRGMPQLAAMGEVGRSEYLSQKAKEFVREHPTRALQLAALKAGRTWSPVPLSREYGSTRNRIIALAYTAPFDLLVLAGLLGSSGLRRSAKVFLLLPAIYFTAVHMMSVGSVRYRLPVEPPMAVIAASVLAGPKRPEGWKRAVTQVSDGVME
jgi:4-amino-4-deoxy-L-arabinose transferase-like glycosyltransferase